MLKQIHQILNDLSINDLRQLNREFGLPVTGNQATLIKRLMIGPKQAGGARPAPEEIYSQSYILNQLIKKSDYLTLLNLKLTNKKMNRAITDEILEAKRRKENISKNRALYKASGRGHLEAVKYLVEHGADVDGYYSRYDYTPLIWASKYGYLDMVKYLIDHGADVNAQRGVEHSTPLIWARKRGHLDIVKYLIDHGADVNLENIFKAYKTKSAF